MNTPQPTTRIPQTLRQQLAGDYFKQQVALSLPKHMTPDRFVRVGLTALLKTPKLQDCTPESVIQCMLNCSALGLEPDGRRAHLIPFHDKKNNRHICTLIIDYKGVVELAKRSGDVSNVFAQIVCEKDNFSWDTGELKHQIDWKNPRGEPYAAYSLVTMKDGSKQSDVMTKDEIYMVREKSSGWRAYKAGFTKDCPWADHQSEPEMWKKTVFKRLSKWLTLSPEVADALEKDEAAPFSAATIVTDIAPPAIEPAIEPDQSPEPAVETAPVAAPVAPAAPAQAHVVTLKQELEAAITDAGFTFDDFARWCEGSGNIPDATSLSGFEEVDVAFCKRLLRSKVGMIKGIATMKGIEQ